MRAGDFAVGAILITAFATATCAATNDFTPGHGVANGEARTEGVTRVAFAPRGAGGSYGCGAGRQYVTPVGLSLLAWSVPNDLSMVYGLRMNLGVSRYEATYGVDAGAWSTSGDFGGIAANVAGNFVNRSGTGVQVGLVNLVDGDFTGVQIGIMNATRHLKGMQVGLMNFNPTGIFFPILNFGL